MTVHERIAGDGRASKVSIRHLAFGLMFFIVALLLFSPRAGFGLAGGRAQ